MKLHARVMHPLASLSATRTKILKHLEDILLGLTSLLVWEKGVGTHQLFCILCCMDTMTTWAIRFLQSYRIAVVIEYRLSCKHTESQCHQECGSTGRSAQKWSLCGVISNVLLAFMSKLFRLHQSTRWFISSLCASCLIPHMRPTAGLISANFVHCHSHKLTVACWQESQVSSY